MLNWDSAWDPSWAAVMNPGQRPRFSAPSAAVKVSEGCVDNLTRRVLGRVTVRSSGLLGGPCCLTSWRLDSDLWSTVCVIWGNVTDDFSLGNMTNESTLSHSEYWSSLSCLCYMVVIYMIRLGCRPWGRWRRKWHIWQVIGLLLALWPVRFVVHCRDVALCDPISRCFSCTPKLL